MENGTTTTNAEIDAPVEVTAKPAKPRAKRKPASGKTVSKKKPERAEPLASSKLVILFRHGIAEDPSEEKADGDRSLTTNGHDRTKRAAKGLSKIVSRVDAIVSSPLLRALQTALWLTKAYGGKVQVQTTDALLPDGAPDEVLRIVREAGGKNIILVGHEPSLTRCMAALLGVPELNANLRRAGCAGIVIDHAGRGRLEWMLTPRTLRGI